MHVLLSFIYPNFRTILLFHFFSSKPKWHAFCFCPRIELAATSDTPINFWGVFWLSEQNRSIESQTSKAESTESHHFSYLKYIEILFLDISIYFIRETNPIFSVWHPKVDAGAGLPDSKDDLRCGGRNRQGVAIYRGFHGWEAVAWEIQPTIYLRKEVWYYVWYQQYIQSISNLQKWEMWRKTRPTHKPESSHVRHLCEERFILTVLRILPVLPLPL